MPNTIKGRAGDARARQEEPARDPHRPGYHFVPPANWMNDPNGLIQWKGEYHMFYQYNPEGPFHNKIHWGHARSTDLVHWTHLPVALAPAPGSADADGCYSGCAVDDVGVPTFVYTGVRGEQELPCVATSADDLLTWQKYPGNPVIAAPPPGLDLIAFRDHSVWKEGDTWYQVIGSGIKGAGGAALLYRSPDLLNWEYLHPLYVGDRSQTGAMWECPDFFQLGDQEDRYFLVVSVWDNEHTLYPVYFAGAYANHRFVPQRLHRLDFGASFYAPQTLRDKQGRRIMWGWLREERDSRAQLAAGWSGAMSLPRVLSLLPGGVLSMRPAPELEMLRGQHYQVRDMQLPQSPQSIQLPQEASGGFYDVGGDMLELLAEFEQGEAGEVCIVVRCAPDRSEQTVVSYNWEDQHLTTDSTQSSLSDATVGGMHSGPLRLEPGETLKLRVFLDRSVMEVFANDRVCITSRVYPTRADSLGIDLLAHGGSARLKSLDIWEVASIWTQEV